MKTFTQFLTVFTAAAIFAAGCINEDPAYRKNHGEKPGEEDLTGFAALNSMEMRVVFEVQSDDTGGETTRPKAASASRTEPDISGYTIEILDTEGTSVKKTTYGELQQMTEPLALPVGSYTLEARSLDEIPQTAWDTPVYIGTKEFQIKKDLTTQLDNLVCTLASVKVTLLISADLEAKLTDDSKATVSMGDKSMAFNMDDTRAAYFMPPAEKNDLKFQLAGKFVATGSDVAFNKTISNVRAGQWRKITLVISYIDKGNIKFDIQVDSFTLDDEIIVDGSESLGQWEPVFDEIDPSSPTMTWTGNDFAHPFQLTADMFDKEGNCSEKFELKLTSPNSVKSFFVTIGTTSAEFTQALGLIGIDGAFDLCALEPADPLYSILKGFQFPVGDEIKGKTAKTFYIGGQLPSMLYGFEGTHTFTFNVADANGKSVENTLTILVDKSNEGPSLVWPGHDLSQKYNIKAGMEVNLNIKARSGIKALQVTIDSETLSPALALVNIPETFDLCAVEGDLANNLRDLGFPVGAEVKDQTDMPFKISAELVTLMLSFSGQHDFIIKVTANDGTTTTKTLQLVTPSK